MTETKPLIRVDNLVKYFPVASGFFNRQSGVVHAVDHVSFELQKGETLGLVGESGCGKSTVGRCILQIHPPTSGHIYYKDQDLTQLRGAELRKMRRFMQMIFQDPYASLNPRMTVERIISEPIKLHHLASPAEVKDQVYHLLEIVKLDRCMDCRYPHEFSGGQRQRIGIARALALQPDFIVCDEPISALDVSIQAQIINLLQDLQEQFSLTYLFIAHDLSVVRHISNRIAVMYLGAIVELADRIELYNHPLHPYTRALLSAVPIPNPVIEAQRKRLILEGDVPSPVNPPSGCRFRTRCQLATAYCAENIPLWREVSPNHWVACHFV